MGDAFAFYAIALVALFAFALVWRVALIFIGAGPATYAALKLGTIAIGAGWSTPWAIALMAATWLAVCAITLLALALVWRAISGTWLGQTYSTSIPPAAR